MIFHGNNLIPEGLEIGEPKISGTASFDELKPCYIIAFSGTQYGYYGTPLSQEGFIYNGILSGITFILCSRIDQIQRNFELINNDTEHASGDHVVAVFSVPRLALTTLLAQIDNPSGSTAEQIALYEYGMKMTANHTESETSKTLVSTPSSIDGYTPRNKKLLTYPYLYLGFNPPNRNK